MDAFLISCVLRGNGQSNPRSGQVSWSLQKQFESICKQFADALERDGDPSFMRSTFFEACGLTKEGHYCGEQFGRDNEGNLLGKP